MRENQHLRTESADSGKPSADIWRNEIHSRITHFRNRRARRIEGAFSMRFPFPPDEEVVQPPDMEAPAKSPERNIRVTGIAPGTAPPSATVVVPAEPEVTEESIVATGPPEIAPESVPELLQAPAPAFPPQLSAAEIEPQPAVQSRPRPKRKVIAFPRQQGDPETVDRLADPVLPDKPRILDVPEEIEAFPMTPFLDGLQFEPATQASGRGPDHIELPFLATAISQRIYAALMDCSLVVTAAAVFGVIGHKMLPDLALTKPARLTAALVPALLWAIYEYLLLVYAGKTVGMQVAAIRLATFKGRRPSLRDRRNRVLGLYLSTASLLMGLLWALVDVDALCWHDRMSGTYLTKRESPNGPAHNSHT
jgi:uncharacterized RDD family membrane protein YckC